MPDMTGRSIRKLDARTLHVKCRDTLIRSGRQACCSSRVAVPSASAQCAAGSGSMYRVRMSLSSHAWPGQVGAAGYGGKAFETRGEAEPSAEDRCPYATRAPECYFPANHSVEVANNKTPSLRGVAVGVGEGVGVRVDVVGWDRCGCMVYV